MAKFDTQELTDAIGQFVLMLVELDFNITVAFLPRLRVDVAP
jgi:hypothetical protein